MKAYISTFKYGLKQIQRDYMLILMLFAPFLCGAVFKFVIPILDKFIADKFQINRVILPYYQILDNVLILITPCIVCIVSCFVILEELDDKVDSYIFITPVGYGGYIIARLIIPSMFAFFLSFTVLMIFKLTEITVLLGIILAFLSVLYALAITLAVISYANNKVEGLALTKLTGVTFIGILTPYLVKGDIKYIFAVLPSFWLGKVSLEYGSSTFLSTVLFGAICSIIWIVIFYRKFKSRSNR